MANIINFSTYQRSEQNPQTPSERKPENDNPNTSEELGIAIQTLIQQLRKAPLQRIS